ncbi:MAG: hypothetical protein IPK30_03100 [Cellvibrionales bacterium]|nr:hypothetical protein [Cellvibrionales bacterium]
MVSRVRVLSFIAAPHAGVIAFLFRGAVSQVLPTLTPVMHDKVLLAAQLLSEIRQYCEKRGMFFSCGDFANARHARRKSCLLYALAEELDERGGGAFSV